jgi:hypothetical protein
MKVLDKPDLDLIKQEDQGCGRFGNVECVHPARGRMKVATDAGVFAADLLQEQQRRVGTSTNGCRPPRVPGARPLRFSQSKEGRTTVRACFSALTWTMLALPAAASPLSRFTHSGKIKFRVGGADVGFGEA